MFELQGRIACLALAGLLALPTAAAGAEPVAFSVRIEAPEPRDAVLENNLDLTLWSDREDVTEEQLRQLVRTAPEQARTLLATEGYFSPTVTAQLESGDAGETRWIVDVQVSPGEPTKVVSVDFQVRGALDDDPEREQRIQSAREAFILNEGNVFRQSDWTASKEGATDSFQRRRYAAAAIVSSRAEIDPETREARLSVEIDSGPPFYFGDVEVSGLQRYAPRFVRNLSPIEPGDPYDEEQLRKYQRRLLASARFASVIVRAANDPAEANATPVYVNVVESQARKVELGVGFSTDRGLRGVAGYTDQNAFDRGLRLNANAEVDRLRQELFAALDFPRNEKGWNYGGIAAFKHEDIQGVDRTDWSVTGLHSHIVEERRSQQFLQLLAENRKLADGTEDNVLALYLAQVWNWNNLDEFLAPRSGTFLSVEVGGASRDIVSDATFGRLVLKGTYFVPVKQFGTVAMRLEAGTVFADNRTGIPSEYLFRTGGDSSVRGYEYESLGVEQNGSITGGRYLLVGSVEYIHWIRQQLGAAIFYDAGNAVDDTSDFEAAVGYGIGARWYSPIGSLNLDVAYGEDVDDYRVHFTAGFALQ